MSKIMGMNFEVGQWYETHHGKRVKVVCESLREHLMIVESDTGPYLIDREGRNTKANRNFDIVKHLPNCEGFDWSERKNDHEYRAFEGADEFRPYSDRLVQPKKISFEEGNSISSFNATGVKMAQYGWYLYKDLFECFVFVDRETGKKSPCGVPVHVG